MSLVTTGATQSGLQVSFQVFFLFFTKLLGILLRNLTFDQTVHAYVSYFFLYQVLIFAFYYDVLHFIL